MPNTESGKIRNVAVIGHRGTGKTSLVEALLYEAGTTNRLGSVADKSSVSDYDEEERQRGMSIAATVTHLEWEERNDQPDRHAGRAQLPGRRAVDAARRRGRDRRSSPACSASRSAPSGCGAAATSSASRGSSWSTCSTASGPTSSPPSRRCRAALADECVAVELPIGAGARVPRRGRPGAHGRLPARRATPAATTSRCRHPRRACRALADEYHDKLMDVVAETSDELMERYLEGDEITREEMAAALKKLVTEGELFPVGCGAATRNIGSHGLLDLIVEGLPSPARARNVPEVGGAIDARLRLQDDRRPVQRQDQPAARVRGHAHLRLEPGQQPHALQGAHRPAADAAGQGPRAHRRARRTG